MKLPAKMSDKLTLEMMNKLAGIRDKLNEYFICTGEPERVAKCEDE